LIKHFSQFQEKDFSKDMPSQTQQFSLFFTLGCLLLSLKFTCPALTQDTSSPSYLLQSEANQTTSKDIRYTHYVRTEDGMPQPQTGSQPRAGGISNYFTLSSSAGVADAKTAGRVHGTTLTPTPNNNSANNNNNGNNNNEHNSKQAVATSQQHTSPQVQIYPFQLDFRERPICIPSVEYVELINAQDKNDLHLLSITSDSVYFHASLFKQIAVPPRSNTSIPVIFLPRSVGHVENTLVMQTDIGGFIYQVSGYGVPNPYMVEPFLGVKIPVNVWYTPPIEIYNPHPDTLIIKEVFTSGGFIHLTLPSNASTNSSIDSRRLWDIPPYERRQIVDLSFISSTPGRYQGFVNVKTSRDTLVIHVEVQVVKGGVHFTSEELDFGTLTSTTTASSATAADKVSWHSSAKNHPNAGTKTLHITLLNSNPTAIFVSEVTLAQAQYADSPHSAWRELKTDLKIDFKPLTLAPNTDTVIASVTFAAKTDGLYKGKLLLRTNDSNPVNSRMEIPYRARVHSGYLAYQLSSVTFPIPAQGPQFAPLVQSIQLTNKFSVPVMIIAAELQDAYFHIDSFVHSQVVLPGATWSGLLVRFEGKSSDLMHSATVLLTTNVSVTTIPLYAYHGRLNVTVPSRSNGPIANGLDFDVVTVNETKVRTLNLSNPNPVKISLLYLSTNLSALTVRLESIWNNRGYTIAIGKQVLSSGTDSKKASTHTEEHDVDASPSSTAPSPASTSRKDSNNHTREALLTLEPGHSAILSLELLTTREEEQEEHLTLHTSYEVLTIPLRYQSVKGRLTIEPKLIRFDEAAFPGRCVQQPIVVHSTYTRPVHITSIHTSDPRFVLVLTQSAIPPSSTSQIGSVIFDPRQGPTTEQYLVSFTESLPQVSELTNDERARLTARDEIWTRLQLRGETEVRASLTLHTDITLMGPTATLKATLAMPHIVQPRLAFNLTQIHTTASQYVRVHNPSDQPLQVQILLPYGGCSPLWRRWSWGWWWCSESPFYLPSDLAGTTYLLAPHTTRDFGPLYFAPHSLRSDNATLLVRNNLTVVETVVVTGEGGSGVFQFISDDYESHSPHQQRSSVSEDLTASLNARPLLFNLHAEQLATCNFTSLTFTHTFHAINAGNLPIHITNMAIDGRNCEHDDFRVVNCDAVVIQPTERYNLTISFTPDFSATTVRRDLLLYTSQGVLTVPLLAVLPPSEVMRCMESYYPHTSKFEQMARNLFLAFSFFLLVSFVFVIFQEYKIRPLGSRGVVTASRQQPSSSNERKIPEQLSAGPSLSIEEGVVSPPRIDVENANNSVNLMSLVSTSTKKKNRSRSNSKGKPPRTNNPNVGASSSSASVSLLPLSGNLPSLPPVSDSLTSSTTSLSTLSSSDISSFSSTTATTVLSLREMPLCKDISKEGDGKEVASELKLLTDDVATVSNSTQAKRNPTLMNLESMHLVSSSAVTTPATTQVTTQSSATVTSHDADLRHSPKKSAPPQELSSTLTSLDSLPSAPNTSQLTPSSTNLTTLHSLPSKSSTSFKPLRNVSRVHTKRNSKGLVFARKDTLNQSLLSSLATSSTFSALVTLPATSTSSASSTIATSFNLTSLTTLSPLPPLSSGSTETSPLSGPSARTAVSAGADLGGTTLTQRLEHPTALDTAPVSSPSALSMAASPPASSSASLPLVPRAQSSIVSTSSSADTVVSKKEYIKNMYTSSKSVKQPAVGKEGEATGGWSSFSVAPPSSYIKHSVSTQTSSTTASTSQHRHQTLDKINVDSQRYDNAVINNQPSVESVAYTSLGTTPQPGAVGDRPRSSPSAVSPPPSHDTPIISAVTANNKLNSVPNTASKMTVQEWVAGTKPNRAQTPESATKPVAIPSYTILPNAARGVNVSSSHISPPHVMWPSSQPPYERRDARIGSNTLFTTLPPLFQSDNSHSFFSTPAFSHRNESPPLEFHPTTTSASAFPSLPTYDLFRHSALFALNECPPPTNLSSLWATPPLLSPQPSISSPSPPSQVASNSSKQ